jgi:16S rRNA (cytidine1402-2'-O)-methyltransferase
MTGTLYVVATPIGNLGDLSPRAREVLGSVAVIAAEDTRVTRKLLTHFEIRTPCTSYHAHSTASKGEALVRRLMEGDDVALVSDAGTPGISDPGALLVRAAVEGGVTVVPIPGPSAVAAALSASGLDPSRFVFEGFLPRGAGDRRRVLEPLRRLTHTLVFYEAPGRVAATLEALRESLGDRSAVVAREVTKKFEEFRRGRLSELAATYADAPPRGECVIIVSGAGDEEPPAEGGGPSSEERLRALLESGVSVKDAARQVATETGLGRKELYALALRLGDSFTAESAENAESG